MSGALRCVTLSTGRGHMWERRRADVDCSEASCPSVRRLLVCCCTAGPGTGRSRSLRGGSCQLPPLHLYAPNCATEPCFSRLVNTVISRAASLHLIKRSIAQFQGHSNFPRLADARAYRSMGCCAEHRSICADCTLPAFSGASLRWVFLDSLQARDSQPIRLRKCPAPLAQPCVCRLLDPTASRFRVKLRLR